MEILLLLVLFLLLAGSFFIFKQAEHTRELSNAMHTVKEALGTELSRQSMSLDSRLSSTSQNIMQLSRHIADIQVSQQEITDLKKEMTALSNLLTIPKLRGNIGELLLADLLRTYFPEERFDLQHRFEGGQTVDACLFLEDDYKLCIDAKFPLESFRRYREDPEVSMLRSEFLRDVKKHIVAIADKYLLPAEKTLDFALMYIPSEHVYYELLTHEDTEDFFSFAAGKKVLPVSPSTLFSYIQILLMGFKGLRIEQHAEQILGHMESVRSLLASTNDALDKGTKHLKNASQSFDETSSQLKKSLTRVDRLMQHAEKEIQEESL